MHSPPDPPDLSLLRLLRTAVDCIEEGVLITDAQVGKTGPHIVFVNRRFEQMTGYQAHEVVGQSPHVLYGSRAEHALFDGRYSGSGEGRAFVEEATGYRKDGSEVPLNWSVCPVTAADGKVTHYVAIERGAKTPTRINDELHRQAVECQQVEGDATRLNDQLAHIARLNTLGEMAGRLAHELNQPLTAIVNYAQGCANRLQSQQIESSELARVLDLMRNAALRAGAIVDRLRNFVRRKGPQQVEVDLEGLIRELLDLIEPEIRQSRVQVELDVAPNLPAVFIDPFQIEQVILNLLRNALEAMAQTPAAQRRLTLRARPSAADEVEVTVCDRGAGLSAEAAQRLFEPFFSTKPFGLGMGLPISRSILEWHGSRLGVDTHADGGACFRFTLPVTHGETSNGNGE